jgi:transcriptional regulator with XRE-family HTH domain
MENLEKKLRYTIGQRLMRLRKKKGLSRKELGEQMAINEKTIGKIETGAFSITLDNLERFQAYYGFQVKLPVPKKKTI